MRKIILLFVVLFILLAVNVNASMINCGNDLGCLADNSENCATSKYSEHRTFDFFGILDVNYKTDVKIRPLKEGNCNFHIKNKDLRIKLNEELKKNLTEQGITEKELRNYERDVNKQVKKYIGYGGVCKFKIEDLHDMLLRWQEGEFSSSDYDNAECRGVIFGTPSDLLVQINPEDRF